MSSSRWPRSPILRLIAELRPQPPPAPACPYPVCRPSAHSQVLHVKRVVRQAYRLREIVVDHGSDVSQTFASWSHINRWLQQVDGFEARRVSWAQAPKFFVKLAPLPRQW